MSTLKLVASLAGLLENLNRRLSALENDSFSDSEDNYFKKELETLEDLIAKEQNRGGKV